MPAPPRVRAAAFRAIASYPDVTEIGSVGGGTALRFPIPLGNGNQARLVVDPATSRVSETNFLADGLGQLEVPGTASITITTAWANDLPR